MNSNAHYLLIEIDKTIRLHYKYTEDKIMKITQHELILTHPLKNPHLFSLRYFQSFILNAYRYRL